MVNALLNAARHVRPDGTGRDVKPPTTIAARTSSSTRQLEHALGTVEYFTSDILELKLIIYVHRPQLIPEAERSPTPLATTP